MCHSIEMGVNTALPAADPRGIGLAIDEGGEGLATQ
jgi:hypothetical protein